MPSVHSSDDGDDVGVGLGLPIAKQVRHQLVLGDGCYTGVGPVIVLVCPVCVFVLCQLCNRMGGCIGLERLEALRQTVFWFGVPVGAVHANTDVVNRNVSGMNRVT